MPIKGINPRDVPKSYRRMFLSNPIVEHFDIEVVSYGPGSAVLRFPYKTSLTQYQGAVQGGVVAGYADAAIVVALLPLVPQGRDLVTTDLHVRFLRPITTGPIVARAEAVHQGKTLLLGNATV